MEEVELTMLALPRANMIQAVRTIRGYGGNYTGDGRPSVSLKEAGQVVEAAVRGEPATLRLILEPGRAPELMADLIDLGVRFAIALAK